MAQEAKSKHIGQYGALVHNQYEVVLLAYLALHRHIYCGRACGKALGLETLDLRREAVGCVKGRRWER